MEKPCVEELSTGETTSGETHCSTSSRIIDQTRIHATVTTTEVENSPEKNVAGPEGEPVYIEKDIGIMSNRILCCAMDPKKVHQESLENEIIETRKRRSENAKYTLTTESIECVFKEKRQDFAPSPMESLSISSGSLSPSAEAVRTPMIESSTSKLKMCCNCSHGSLPPLDLKLWPQAPLLFRPQPSSGTKIIGIRKDGSKDYLWQPNKERTAWWQVLQEEWGSERKGPELSPCCQYCAILPINNGNEAEGDSLVTDFESDLFSGSLMLRLRHSEGTSRNPSDDTKGFFAGKPFRYQAIIRGSYKKDLPYTELVTGTILERPCGKLPPKWVMWTALKVVGFFAPQLKTKLDIAKPYTLSPLGSAPRTVTVEENSTGLLAQERVEPTDPKYSLGGKAYPISSHLERARARKRHFDQLYMAKKQQPRADPSKTYTMEFLQHLFDYQKFSIDLGSFHLNTKDILDGQPLQLMAKHGDSYIWGFEIWNESLLKDAKKHLS